MGHLKIKRQRPRWTLPKNLKSELV